MNTATPTETLTITDLLTMGEQAFRAEAEAQRAKEEARLAEKRAQLQSALPDEGWALLNIDPLTATESHGKLGMNAAVAFPDMRLTFGVSMDNYGRVYMGGHEFSRVGSGNALDPQRQVAALARLLVRLHADAVKKAAEARRNALASAKNKLGWNCYGIADLRALAAEINESHDLLPVDKKLLLREVAQQLNAARLKRNEQRRERAQKIADAKIVIALAAEYVQLAASHREVCRQWAEAETARLWEPFTLWKVRYAPMALTLPIVPDEEGGIDLIHSVVVLDKPSGGSLQTVRVVDRYDGSIRPMVIGAFLDAEPFEVKMPSIDEGIAYCRKYYDSRSGYRVNVPPTVEAEPEPQPHWPHGEFTQFVAARHTEPLAVRIDDYTVGRLERIAAQTPEEYAFGE